MFEKEVGKGSFFSCKNYSNILILSAVLILAILLSVSSVLAVDFAGYTYNATGDVLNATNITIEVWQNTPQWGINSTYSNLSNANGYWTVTVPNSVLVGTNNMIKFVPRHYTSAGYADYVGAVLPQFPYVEISRMLNTSNITFYLKEGATINITALNQTGEGPILFNYMVKDTRLGFSVEEDWQNQHTQKTIYVPADRNYSIEIFPRESMPIYYDLNNLSAYDSPKKVDVIFNTTSSSIRVSGNITLSNGTRSGFQELNILNYLLEPGNMVFSGQPMPYNMSAWNMGGTDIYDATGGFYNISLEGSSMTTNVLMVVIAKVGDEYYAGFRNITAAIGTDVTNFNFNLSKLLGVVANISVQTATGGALNITAAETTFALINSSGSLQTTETAHLEVELQYSNINPNMPDFTWMVEVSQSSQGIFRLPLLNYTIRKLNLFSQKYAPLKLPYTAAQIDVGQVNITLRNFNPGEIDSGDEMDDITVAMYKSSAECDVPTPPASCTLTSTASEGSFSPLNAVISGGKISFRISRGNTGMTVHYKNVDLIASGPPDAMFDSSSNQSGAATLESAWRFGSRGPEIYDGILIGVPYNDTEYDESKDFSVTIKKLYDADWNIVWSTADSPLGNGTPSDYSAFNVSWFNQTAGGMPCSKTDSSQNCFVNTTTNIIWLTIPHFSGLGPQIGGYAILGTLSSDLTIYSCYPTCSANINVTINNTALNGTQTIYLNNTAVDSGLTYKIYGKNGTSTWLDLGENNTAKYYNLSYGVNEFRINITMPTPLSTKWNFSINVNGSYYTLDPYLDAINLTTPIDNFNTSDPTPDFRFYLFSDSQTSQNCTLMIISTNYGQNSSTTNGVATTLTANTALADGTYTWYISCNATGDSVTRTLNIVSYPQVNLNGPIPGYNSSSSDVIFNFTAINTVSTLTCNLTLDGLINLSDFSAGNGTPKVNTVSGIAEGSHVWNVTCWDSNNNTNTSVARAFKVDTTAPTVNSESSTTTSVAAGGAVYIAANFSDATTGVRTVRLFVNGTGNATNSTSAISSSVMYNFTYTALVSQIGQSLGFTINATDFAGNSNVTSIFAVTISDNVPPNLVLISPVTGSNSSDSGAVTFQFNVSDNVDTTLNCNLTIDDINRANITVISSAVNVFGVNVTTITGLTDGAHLWNITCWDTLFNANTSATRTFTVDTVAPQVTINSPAAATNMTATSTGINVTVNTEATTGVKTYQYNTSCNPTLSTFSNTTNAATLFFPFNKTGCTSSNGFRTLYIHVTDHAGNVNNTLSRVYGVDTVAPQVTINSPTADQEISSANVTINFTTVDFTYISALGYYLDSGPYVSLLSNIQTGTSTISINVTYGGTHTLILQATDSLTQAANSSSVTFTAKAPVDVQGKQAELNASLGSSAISSINIRYANGTDITQELAINSSTPTIAIDLELNTSISTAVNMTIDGINASAVQWGNINFTVTSDDTPTKNQIMSNLSAVVKRMVRFNSTIRQFLPNNNSYFGRLTVPFNVSDRNHSKFVVYFFEDETDYSSTITPVSACSGAGQTTPYLATTPDPCYNVTSNSSTTIFVPHFSTVVLANDTMAPTIAITAPGTTQTDSTFRVNITVSADTVSCYYILNASGHDTYTSWASMLPTGISPKECLSGVISLPNATGSAYNLTINVTDANGNQNITYKLFTVADIVPPQYSNITNTSITSSGATISVTSNEYVNASVTFTVGTVVAQSIPFTTKTPSIVLTVPASTFINYTVKVCDYAGNCNSSVAYNFTSSAAETTTTTTSSGSSGGGGGVAATTNTAAKTSHLWTSLASGESASMKISNEKIAITEVLFSTVNELTDVKIQVSSLKAKPDSLDAPGKVYQYLEIEPTNVVDIDIATAKITFEVTKEWLTANSLAETDIVLFRYTEGSWKALATTVSATGDLKVTYEATTPGFSYFAIGAKSAEVTEEAEEAVQPPAEPTAEPTAEPEQPTAEEAIPIPEGKKGISTVLAVLIIIAAIILIGAVVYRIQLKTSTHHKKK